MEGFVREVAHFDRAITPLFATLALPAIQRGYAAFQASRLRREDALELRVMHQHVYARWNGEPPWRIAPHPDHAPEDVLDAVARWERVVVPEVLATLDRMRALCRDTHSPRRVAADLDRLEDAMARLYELQFDVGEGARTAISVMEATLAEAGEPDPALRTSLLLAPCDSLLRSADSLLARAAASGRAPDLSELGLSERPSRLDLDAPTWGEDDSPVRAIIAQGQAALVAFEEGTRRALARREDAERDVLARFPPEAKGDVVGIFELLRRARGLSQDVNYLVGERMLGIARLAALRAASVAGVAEVHLWEKAELQAALRGEPTKDIDAPRAALAAARAGPAPPRVVGVVPDGLLQDARMAALLGFEVVREGDLVGLAASPGVARGRARVLVDEGDISRVLDGDVLVVASLPPTWTPAMFRACAIVTQSGGMLSHGAVVARELGKPAVVGVAGVMAALRDGALVEVDGTLGRIKIE